MKKTGFTLIEIIISMTIVATISAGIFNYISHIDFITQNAKKSMESSVALGDFIYEIGLIKDKLQANKFDIYTSSGYDFLVLSGSTYGALVGIIDSNRNLDKVNNFYTYDIKKIALKILTASEISSIKTNSGTAYNMVFDSTYSTGGFSNKIYEDIYFKNFKLKSFNSGSILDINLEIYDYFEDKLKGSNINDLILPNTKKIILNL